METRHSSRCRSLLVVILLLFIGWSQNAMSQWPPPPPSATDWTPISTQAAGPFDVGSWVSAVGPSGGVYVAGRIRLDPRIVTRVARWSGGIWTPLGDRFDNGTQNATPNAITVDGNGDVYLAGDFTIVYNSNGTSVVVNGVARWNAGTGLWEAMGGGVNIPPSCLAVLGNDVYVGGGTFIANPGGQEVPIPRIGRWNVTSNSWSAVGGGVAGSTEFVLSMISTGSSVYVGGSFTTATNPGGAQVTVNNIALWDGGQWQTLGQGLFSTTSVYATNLALNSANDLYVGGVFQQARNGNGTSVPGPLVRWNGTVWSNESQGLPVPAGTTFLNDIAIDGSDMLCAYYYDALASPVAGNFLARRNAQGQWVRIAQFSGEILTTIAGRPGQLAEGLYAGGLYNQIIDPSTGQTHIILNNAQWFPGSGWSAMVGAGQGANGYVFALGTSSGLEFSGTPDFVYAGGSFSSMAGVTADNIARYDGLNWRPLGGGVNGEVHAICFAAGRVFVGGNFTSASGVNVNNVAVWSPFTETWSPVARGVSGPVYAMDAYSLAGIVQLFVGGAFDNAYAENGDTIRVNSIVEFRTLNISIDPWEVDTLGGGIAGGNREIRAIARHGSRYTVDEDMYIGGSFDAVSVGGTQIAARNIGRWNILTNTWRPVGQGVNGTVRALAFHNTSIPPVWVGGDFTVSTNENGSQVTTPYLALWNDVGNQWNTLRGGTDGPVHAIERIYSTHYDGAFIGGEFTRGLFENGNAHAFNHVGLYVLDQQPRRPVYFGWNGRPDIPDTSISGVSGPVYALLSLNPCRGFAENVYVGGDFIRAGLPQLGSAGGIARWRYVWQYPYTGIMASGGVSRSGGSNTGGGVKGVASVPPCSPLVSHPVGPPDRILFDSLGFGRSVQVDSLQILTYFNMQLFREGTSTNPLFVTDSAFIGEAVPSIFAFIGVEDTSLFAPNPGGRSTAFNMLIKPLPINAVEETWVHLMFLHAVTDAPAINVVVQGAGQVIQGLQYGDASDSTISLPAGSYVFEVRRNDNGQLINTQSVDLTGQDGEVVVLGLTGFLDPSANQNGPPISLNEYTTGVPILTEVDSHGSLPTTFAMYQNYPNPFNPTTTIVFTLPSLSTTTAEGRERVGSHVTLRIYDILGREVATLVNERLGPGRYERMFDARGLASGVYLYRLNAGSFVDVKKLLLLK